MLSSAPADLRRLWLLSVVAIVAILFSGILVSRVMGPHPASPIPIRLAGAAVVTLFAAIAKVLRGPRAAAVTAVVGTFVLVVVLLVAYA